MNKIDLNMENYELEDILRLFKITDDFTEMDLKSAKLVVLKTHPDKSGLNPDYFRFFSRAYKILYEIWEFKNKSKNKGLSQDTEYSEHCDSFDREKKELLDKFLEKGKKGGKTDKDFNKWFNQQFEKNKLEREEDSYGYGGWFESNEDIDNAEISSLSQMASEFEKKKSKLSALTKYDGVGELSSFYNGASNIAGDVPDNFSSDLFSSLQFEDLKKAHTETLVPVTLEDYNKIKKFKNVNEYNEYRQSQNIVPLSEAQSREYLSNKEKMQEKASTERAYKLAKQLEESQKKDDKYWASLRFISNG